MKVDRERCIGCRQCFAQCPVRAISLREGKADIHQDAVWNVISAPTAG